MLTEQRKLFVEEHLKLRCKNATQAAINAGYSEKSAAAQASQILKDTEVSAYLEERKSQIRRDLQQEFLFDALEARKTMYRIMQDENVPIKDRLTAARDFLDRAGFKATEKDVEEQIARIEKLKAETARIKSDDSYSTEDDGFIEALRKESESVWEE